MLEGRLLVSAIMLVAFAAAVGLSFTYAPDARFLPLVVGIPGLLLSAIQLINELRDAARGSRRDARRAQPRRAHVRLVDRLLSAR